ncbi:MAG: hypothetical protein JRD04_12830 [Deltaproteobacteria bacterium]|nr:hypothetical protein [Deltaproteobacteria bacterium]
MVKKKKVIFKNGIGNLSKFLKIFGLLYFLLNFIGFAALLVLAINAAGKYLSFSPGWVYLLSPAIGVLSGYWIYSGKFGWGRSLVIAFSLLCSAATLFIVFVAVPQVEHLNNEVKKQAAIVQKNQLDPNVERLFLGVYSGDIAIVTEQLNKDVDVNARNETRQTALHVTQNPDIARLLIEHGADIGAKNDSGAIPIFNKEVNIVKILLAAGTDINARDEEGNTLLIWYSYSGYLEGIQFLVKRGIDINACNTDRQNSLNIAEHFQPNTDTMTYLQTLNIQPCAE